MAAAKEEEKVAATATARKGHPLLRGRNRGKKYTHGLHPAQMEALRAMCGAIIPAVPPVSAAEGLTGGGANADGGREDHRMMAGSKDLERFYLASAADGTIPDKVAELVTRCVWEATVLVSVVLWILSTRIGTLALCVAGKFPYYHVCRFAGMPVERREEALQRWNKARWMFPLKIAFVVIKFLSHYAFYTMVNESSNNPCWKAIGYSVPELNEPRKEEGPAEARPSPRPLDAGVVETRGLNDATLLRSLEEKGLAVAREEDASGAAHHTVRCDAVVVGSGCDGGVAAAVLAAAGHRVVVVEKGDYFTAADYSSVEGPSMDRLYEKGGVTPATTTGVTSAE